jgi:hypothetical protein
MFTMNTYKSMDIYKLMQKLWRSGDDKVITQKQKKWPVALKCKCSSQNP